MPSPIRSVAAAAHPKVSKGSNKYEAGYPWSGRIDEVVAHPHIGKADFFGPHRDLCDGLWGGGSTVLGQVNS